MGQYLTQIPKSDQKADFLLQIFTHISPLLEIYINLITFVLEPFDTLDEEDLIEWYWTSHEFDDCSCLSHFNKPIKVCTDHRV